jgi:tetratricopeptide (TPR) repeat protein
MTLYFWLAGDYARALASGQRALAIAQALDDFPLQVRTHFFLGITYHALGEYCRAIEVLRWNVASLDGELIWRSLGMQGLPAVLSRSWLVWCLAEGGTFAEGIARGAEGYRIAEAADNPFSLVVAYFSVSNLYVCKGEVHQAIPVLERSLEIFRTGDLPVLFPYVASLLEPV